LAGFKNVLASIVVTCVHATQNSLN
jgi:hypothetical protein